MWMSAMKPAPSRATLVLVIGRISNRFLLRALVNPCAEQADLFLGQRGIFVALFRGRHFHVLDQTGSVGDHGAFGAVAGDNGRVPAFAALDHRGEAVHAVFALGLFAAVSLDAGLLEQRFDVLLVSQSFLVRGGRQFAGVPGRFLFLLVVGAQERRRGQAQ